MATVLAVSSFVARGTVGLRAIMPALGRHGHETIALPTIVLSNHLGHPRASGSAIPAETLSSMIDMLDSNGWLEGVDAVQTGYLPSADHVHLVETLVKRLLVHRPDALIVCDPVLGDHPGGLYVPAEAAKAVRDRLMPLATHMKPNRFELAFLSGHPVETMSDIVAAARSLPPPVVLASSIPMPENRLANVLVEPNEAAYCTVPLMANAPHGTGDLLTAVFVSELLSGRPTRQAAAEAVVRVRRAVDASYGADELALSKASVWEPTNPIGMADLETGFD
ncbi:bifunctional hydroxymethylpyrimidine kinase/phosphomethylpyrimidine kinase [Hyphomicrobium sp. CS1GBMeth3]|uniref:bifunctional hydroxymethylpyrimidine kinase/phosphomethylpyrimidine kinase n=1 Tax=Hyphomicrobium sp. CS1GBMeth3 TaxID=1892845 RepID=UPI000931643D|nr:bifunctional hydroxymethylpyrimidine kinase/phosphomethylpyrimidine kinase [Hyphomicrobium sp. CS1GBMeth3]